jgi:hypothetical protein
MAAEFSARSNWTPPASVAVCVALLALPWLWPVTFGPSPNVVPLLVAWSCGLLALLVIVFSRDPFGVLHEAVPRAWLAAALLSSFIGLLQWFGVAPQITLINAAQIGEAYGNLRQKNQFASLTAIGLAVLVCRSGPLFRPTHVVAVLLLATGNALSASRTGLLEWLAIGAVAVAWRGARKDRLALCTVGLAGYVAAGALAPHLLSAWHGLEATNVFMRVSSDLGCSSRKVLWSNVLHLIAQRPWAGWGLGDLDYAHFMTIYPGERFCDILDNAHNLPLHLAVELGLPVALLLVGAATVAVCKARPWAEVDAARQLSWLVLLVLAIHSQLEYPLWYGPFQLAALLSVAMLWRRWGLPTRMGQGLAAAGVMVAMGGLATVLLAYDRVSDAYRPPEERRTAVRQDPAAALEGAVLFRDAVRFARLSLMPVTRANAAQVHALAREMLHYSPEPAVIEKLLDSGLLLGRQEDVVVHALRYKAAFPNRYEAWRAARDLPESNQPQLSPAPRSQPAPS